MSASTEKVYPGILAITVATIAWFIGAEIPRTNALVNFSLAALILAGFTLCLGFQFFAIDSLSIRFLRRVGKLRVLYQYMQTAIISALIFVAFNAFVPSLIPAGYQTVTTLWVLLATFTVTTSYRFLAVMMVFTKAASGEEEAYE